MKRCPECLFIYPESDVRCDFDNTPLVVVDDAEIDSATRPAAVAGSAKKKRGSASKKRATKTRKKGAVIATGLALGLSGLFVYYSLNLRAGDVEEIPPVATAAPSGATSRDVGTAAVASRGINASSSPRENGAATPVSKGATARTVTSHSRATARPVSTSGPGMRKRPGGKPVIVLTSGAKIDADEVWRTRDGVWYRRAGIVTLLKHNRVRAVVNQ